MTIPIKKLNNSFSIPVFGIGTWLMGGDKKRNHQNDDEGQIEAIKKAVELGIMHIDTAENYAEGWAEKLVSEAIKRFNRKKLFITSKVSPAHLRYGDLLQACENSLKRLKIDYLDLYLIHSSNDEIPIEETMQAMDRLVEDKLVKNIGVSNFKTSRLIDAQKYTKNKIVTNRNNNGLLTFKIHLPPLLPVGSRCKGDNWRSSCWLR